MIFGGLCKKIPTKILSKKITLFEGRGLAAFMQPPCIRCYLSDVRVCCGNGQMSNGQTTLEENLSFCVERDVHHHGNCRSGLVNSIPFVKKRTHSPPPPT
jgi:hypothetical protein